MERCCLYVVKAVCYRWDPEILIILGVLVYGIFYMPSPTEDNVFAPVSSLFFSAWAFPRQKEVKLTYLDSIMGEGITSVNLVDYIGEEGGARPPAYKTGITSVLRSRRQQEDLPSMKPTAIGKNQHEAI